MAGRSQSVRRVQNGQDCQQSERRRWRKRGMRLKLGASGGDTKNCQKFFGVDLVAARPGSGGDGGDGATTRRGKGGAVGGGDGVAARGSGGGGGAPPPPTGRVSARKLAASKWAEIEISALAPPFAALFRPPPSPSPSPDTHALHPSDASPSISLCPSPRGRFPSLPPPITSPVMPRHCPQLRTDAAIGPESKSIAVMPPHPPRQANCLGNLISQRAATLQSAHGMGAVQQVAALAKKLHVGEAGLISFPKDNSKAYNRLQSSGAQHRGHASVVSALREELELARIRLQNLDVAQTLARKEVDILLERCAKESTTWKSREQKKVESAMLLIGKQLEEERKTRRKLELQYKNLSRNLSEVSKAAAKAMNELKKERNARKLMEDVCDELAKEIGADKAEFEELKREHAKAKYEIEEERIMFQTAQLWREERAQIKFSEARLELEERSIALDKLTAELDAFLRSKRTYRIEDTPQQQADANQSDMLREAVGHLQKQTAMSVRLIEDTICQSA